MTINKDSMLPCSLIMLIRVSITMNVPVLPIPALKKNNNDNKTCQPVNSQIKFNDSDIKEKKVKHYCVAT